jgi:hypothetical protein
MGFVGPLDFNAVLGIASGPFAAFTSLAMFICKLCKFISQIIAKKYRYL